MRNGLQRVAKCLVPSLGISGNPARLGRRPITRCVAVIIFPLKKESQVHYNYKIREQRVDFPYIIDAPAPKQLSILRLVALRARVTRAGHGACITIKTELKALSVDLIHDCRDTVRPFAWVRNESTRRTA